MGTYSVSLCAWLLSGVQQSMAMLFVALLPVVSLSAQVYQFLVWQLRADAGYAYHEKYGSNVCGPVRQSLWRNRLG